MAAPLPQARHRLSNDLAVRSVIFWPFAVRPVTFLKPSIISGSTLMIDFDARYFNKSWRELSALLSIARDIVIHFYSGTGIT